MRRPAKILLWTLALLLLLPIALVCTIVGGIKLADRTNGTIDEAGIQRRYLLYVPKSYDGSRAVPLVVSLHPAAGWPALVRDMSQWNRLADQHGFLVVYPAGTHFPQIWITEHPDADAKFISDLLDQLAAKFKIDPDRIYINGMSQGGGMAFLLSCKLPGRFAAVGEVAAAQEHSFSDCGDSTPTPMIAFHGTADKYAPYRGGMSPVEPPGRPPFPAIPEFVSDWARRNQCDEHGSNSQVTEHVQKLAYTNCANQADVVLYTIAGGGHTWPGGQDFWERTLGSPTREIQATQLLWDFYQQHPRSRR